MEIINLFDIEKRATERLDPMTFGYYASGAMDEITLSENRTAYDRIKLAYHVLANSGNPKVETELLGKKLRMPILIAPMAFQKLAHQDGEIAVARAANQACIPMVLSTLSTTAMEKVVAETQQPVWFQLYIYKDRQATEALVNRAEKAGCQALVLTVDAPRLGRRERDMRNRFNLPEGISAENLLAHGYGQLEEHPTDSGLAAYFASLLDPNLSWKDLQWLASITKLPIFIKGVVRVDDALKAADHGISGLIVSNHGGRQLDTAPATIDVLGEITTGLALAGFSNFPVLIDGGIRRGTDIVKALALGAKAVLVGRPVLWGLTLDGTKGVRQVCDILYDELILAMSLCGCSDLQAIGRDLVRQYKCLD